MSAELDRNELKNFITHKNKRVKIKLMKMDYPEKYELFCAILGLPLYDIISVLKLSGFNMIKKWLDV